MESLDLGSVPYHERLTFVWLAFGPAGAPRAAFVIDGRHYADADEARAAVREALEQTALRAEVADFRPASIAENEADLAAWTSWEQFRRYLDADGPFDPWPEPSDPPAAQVLQFATVPSADHPAAADTDGTPGPAGGLQTSLSSGRHFECWGELVVTFPEGQGPYDPILSDQAEGYGLNTSTGEFEPGTRRALQCAHGLEDDETWPMRDEDAFIEAVEERRERLLRTSFYQRHDKPEIFAAYERAARDGTVRQSRRATYEMWRQAQQRRAFFLVGTEPVRVDLEDDGTPVTAWRLDMTSGRIVSTNRADAQGVMTGEGTRVSEHAWLLAVEDRRRALDVNGAIGEAYAKADGETDEAARRSILTHSFDLWAERFAGAGEAGDANL
jgi:hypothetical protein